MVAMVRAAGSTEHFVGIGAVAIETDERMGGDSSWVGLFFMMALADDLFVFFHIYSWLINS